jgi:MFS family permease
VQAETRTSNRRLVLGFLLAANILNFLDRQILGILAQPIKADLHLSDTQFGAIGGLAFALLYSLLGIPLAYLADRTSRSGVIAGALALWSAFTALCGTATGYWQLFLYRLGVGFGEAGGVAPSYALIADYFPPARRARALAIFSLGVPIGLGGGSFVGAQLASAFGWRAAFLIMGIAGVILAPIVRLVVRDVARPAATHKAPLISVFPMLARKPAFWLLAFGASASSCTEAWPSRSMSSRRMRMGSPSTRKRCAIRSTSGEGRGWTSVIEPGSFRQLHN